MNYSSVIISVDQNKKSAIKIKYDEFKKFASSIRGEVDMYISTNNDKFYPCTNRFITFIEYPYKLLSRYKKLLAFMLFKENSDEFTRFTLTHDNYNFTAKDLQNPLINAINNFCKLFSTHEHNYSVNSKDNIDELQEQYAKLAELRNKEVHDIFDFKFVINNKSCVLKNNSKDIIDLIKFIDDIRIFVDFVDEKFDNLYKFISQVSLTEKTYTKEVTCYYIGYDYWLYKGYINICTIFKNNIYNFDTRDDNFEVTFTKSIEDNIINNINNNIILMYYDNNCKINLLKNYIRLDEPITLSKLKEKSNGCINPCHYSKSYSHKMKTTRYCNLNNDTNLLDYLNNYYFLSDPYEQLYSSKNMILQDLVKKYFTTIYYDFIIQIKNYTNKAGLLNSTRTQFFFKLFDFFSRYIDELNQVQILDIFQYLNVNDQIVYNEIEKILDSMHQLMGTGIFEMYNKNHVFLIKKYMTENKIINNNNNIINYIKSYVNNNKKKNIHRCYAYILILKDNTNYELDEINYLLLLANDNIDRDTIKKIFNHNSDQLLDFINNHENKLLTNSSLYSLLIKLNILPDKSLIHYNDFMVRYP